MDYKCIHHGDLLKEQISITTKRGKPAFRCKLCLKISWGKIKQKFFGMCNKHGVLTPEIMYQNGTCKLCLREKTKKYKKENKALVREKVRKDREKNPEKWDKIYKIQYQKNKLKYGALHSLKKCCEARGITIKDYQDMQERQKYVCAICSQPETRLNGRTKDAEKKPLRLVIDHCHKTKKVRGLLCHNCNSALGKFFDDVPRMIRASRYVKCGGFNDENNKL